MSVRTISMPARVLARWDRLAVAQLCATAAELAAENEQLRRDLTDAHDRAEHWYDVAMGLDDIDGSPVAEGISLQVLA